MSKNSSGGQKNKPLVVVVGETASGKSTLAMDIAKKYDGEIIAADSRTIFKGMDIGTAKPSKQDQKEIPHHLLDIALPNERFTAAAFQKMAEKAIEDIHKRHKLPVMVGGSGLYVDSVVFNYSFDAPNDEDRQIMRENTLVIGIKIPKKQLRERITQRVEKMFKQGLRKEVDELQKKYGWDSEAMTGIGYREFKAFYDKQASMSQIKRDIVQNTIHFAKRQRTWFKRNPQIKWFQNPEDALKAVKSFLTETKSK